MAEPKGWQVLEALAAVLAGMTGTRPWGGRYPSDPVVDHKFRSPRTSEDFLRIRVLEGSGSSTEIISLEGEFEQTLRVKIEASIIGDLDQPPQGWIQRVKQDLLVTVVKNWALGALDTELDERYRIDWTSSESEAEGDFGQQVLLTMSYAYKFREALALA